MGDGNWVFELLFSCFCILVIFGCGGDWLGGVYVGDWEECGLNMIFLRGMLYIIHSEVCVPVCYLSQAKVRVRGERNS